MRNFLILFLGLAIGAAAAVLIRDSIPPASGTAEDRILSLERELSDTRQRLAKIDPSQARQRDDTGNAINMGIRNAFADLKAGRPVDVNNLFNAVKPLLRDLSPIFDNIRRKNERLQMEHMAGEFARKYDLSPNQQAALQVWLRERSEKNAEAFKALVLAERTSLDDMIKVSKSQRREDGIDGFMEEQLKGEKLATYRRDRLTERAERVTSEADSKVQRLHGIVELDETQQDQVFSITARSSPEFDPQMQIEGVSAEAGAGTDRDAAIMNVLRPDQQQKYEQWRAERRARTEQEFTDIGLKMPESYDALSAE